MNNSLGPILVISCILVFFGDPPAGLSGNLLLDQLLGVEIV
jgi:hypothetical protein